MEEDMQIVLSAAEEEALSIRQHACYMPARKKANYIHEAETIESAVERLKVKTD